ncbi:serine/threonine-protein kinase Pink1, mitochondrial [Frankliniella occidentalis]|uniref:non-specific serine/threonine protein kinase n=1 Tax=Frankliniella occidentalis TaxID=133901 RepID=A0A9C6X8J8_FRAOC|nr:serine/threonine-protein kinase Pink1, mitochondrial [Frankliniella occidentalis]
MSIKACAFRLLRNGRTLLRHFWTNPASKDVVDGGIVSSASTVRIVREHARRLLIDNVVKRVSNSTAAELRRRAAKRLLYGNAAPFLAFVGVNLASGTSIITEEDELEAACWGIRETVSAMDWTFVDKESDVHNIAMRLNGPFSLENFIFGKAIAKGCNGVVYTAKIKSELSPDMDSNIIENDDKFPLAVKMMFNYDAESNAMSILRAMHRETVPALSYSSNEEILVWEDSFRQRCRALPQHPNIVRIYNAFTDSVQALPGSLSLYPDALPARINPNGFGRNMSLFLVMKRYDMSLKDFLCQHPPNTKIAIMLLTQLLEAVTHMVSNGVAHRDLKADNILLDLDESDTMCPTLAVTDFGCCLADQVYGLSLHYTTPDTDKGGNAALMAPEVACAEPGPFTYINYNKADVWAVGTLAYQLFGMDNPFHRISNNQGLSGTGTKFLLSATYTESELPPFPETVPSIISKLVMEMLMRNPSRRITAELAATVCQLYLWAPSSWIQFGKKTTLPSSSEILQWLFCLTTKVVSEGRRISSAKFMSDEGEPLFKAEFNSDLGHASPEYNLVESFLRRIKLSVVRDALQWINQA